MAQTDVGIRLSLDGQAAVTSGLRQVEGSMGGLSRATDVVGASFKNLAATAAAGLSVRAFVQAADAVTILNNQLKLATGSTQAASKAYTALFDIAQRSRVSFTELGGTFASISRAGEALGVSQTRLLAITESISNAVAISGGSAESARASLVQLSQGLASGTLRGDELNSVMEQTPRLAKALADGLGVSTGELRKMGEQGKITASAVIGALESQAKVLSGEVKNSVVTVGQAFTTLQNATVLAAGEFDKASGISNTLASALQGVAGVVQTVGAALKENQTAIQTTAGALAGLASVAIVGKLAAVATGIGGVSGALVILRGVVASLNPWTLALLVGGTTVGAVSAYADAQSKTIKGMASDLRELERLNARAAADPSDAILNARVGERTKKILELRTEIERLSKAQAKASGPDGSVGSGDTALRRELARQEALKVPDKDAIANAAKAQKAALAEMSKALDTHNALVSKGTGYASDYADKLADLALLQKAGKISTDQLKDAQAELEKAQPYAIEQAKMWSEQTKASAKAIADSISAYEQYTKALDDSADSVAAQVQKLQDEEAAAIIAAAQNISLAQAIEQVTIARLNEAQAKEYANGNQEAGDAIKREIEQRKLLATALGSKETREASIKSAKEAADDWKKAGEKINDSITDALLRGFESGKGFAENLRDVVVNMFKTMVLRPTVSAIVTGLTGLGGAANAATGAGGSAAGSVAGSFAQSALGNITIAGSSVAAIGSSVMAGIQAGYAGTSIAGAASAYSAAGMTGVSTGLTAGSAIGSSAAAIQATLAAIPGWGWAAMAALAAVAIFNNKQWETKYGGSFDNSGANGAVNKLYGPGTGGEFANQFAQTALKATENSINAVFAKIGSASRVGYFSAGAESSKEGEAYAYAGGRLASGQAFGQIGSEFNRGNASAEEATANYVRELQQSTLQALQAATDIPQAIASKLAGIDINALAGDALTKLTADIDTFINTVVGVQASLSATPFANLKALSFDATAGLIAFSGGLDKLQANLASYYDNFFTAEEKRKQTLQEITTVLNAAGANITADQVGTASRAQFRAAAEGINLTTESGQKLYAAMMAVSGAFASVVPAATSVSASVEKISDTLQSLNADTAALQIELLTAQGKTQGAAEALKALETKGFKPAELAAYELNAGLRKTISTLNAVTEAANNAAASQTSLAAKYANPLTVQSASALLPDGLANALLAQGSAQIRDTIAGYIKSLDPLTEAGRAAITQVDGLSGALDVLVAEVDRIAAQDAAATLQAAADAQATYTRAVETATQKLTAAQAAVASANSAVDAVRAEGTNAYLSALQAVATAQDRVTSAQLDAQSTIAREANAAAAAMRGLGASLREFIDGAALPPTAQFGKLLAAALGGDKAAMQALPGAATGAIDDAKLTASNFSLEKARILAQVSAVATAAEFAGRNTVAEPTAMDALAEAQQDLAAAQATLAQSLAVANTIGAPLAASVTDLVAKFANAQAESAKALQDLAAAQQTLAAIQSNTLATAGSTSTSLGKLDSVVTATATVTTAVGAMQSVIGTLLDRNFGALDTSLNGLLDYTEFASGLNGLATDSQLRALFNEIDTNGDGQINKLEAIRLATEATKTATEATARSTASFATGASSVVSFAANDPIRSVFANIGRTNNLLIDSQQLFLTQLLGVGIGEDLQALGAQNSAFEGTYSLQAKMLAQLQSIASYAYYLPGIATESYNTNVNWHNGVMVRFDRGSTTGGPGGAVFAQGGAFTNSIVSRPTSFNMGLMGEAGPEAIMPLANINGSLGVRFAGNNSNDALVGEIRRLRESNERLEQRLANIEASTNSSATSNALTADSTRSMDKNGVLIYTDPAEPIKTEVVAA